jgi:hypothetical protein
MCGSVNGIVRVALKLKVRTIIVTLMTIDLLKHFFDDLGKEMDSALICVNPFSNNC